MKRPKALVRRVAYQGLQAQTDCLGIRGRTAGQPGLSQEAVIDVEGFLHIIDANKSMAHAALHRKRRRGP